MTRTMKWRALTRARLAAAALVLLGSGCAVAPAGDGELSGASGTPAPASLQVLGCHGGYGNVGAVYAGIPVYCQATSAGGYYQCDELANRFMRDSLQHADIDNVVTDNASGMCAQAARRSDYSVWGPGYRNPAGHQPGPGDLIVWISTQADPPGHVAVVTGAHAASVDFVQQNVTDRPFASTAWDGRRGFGFTDPDVECWIHAEGGPSLQAPPQTASCGCFDGDGDYCGLAVVDHERWYGCRADHPAGSTIGYRELYSCKGGVFTPKQSCKDCLTTGLFSAHGVCVDGDPCGHVPSTAANNGLYCGSTQDNGFGGGDPDTLYDCEDASGVTGRSYDVVHSERVCGGRCLVNPGKADSC
jgi:hypothetical protein